MFGKESPFKNRKHKEESKKLISENHVDVSGENNPMFKTKGGMCDKKHTLISKQKIGNAHKYKV